jgi:DNA polymerase-3 subunit delta
LQLPGFSATVAGWQETFGNRTSGGPTTVYDDFKMDSNTFLDSARPEPPQPVYVVHGDEDFLKRQVLCRLRERILGSGDDEFGLSTVAGDEASFADVQDELHTLPLVGERRLVIVENADPFVTEHRAALEKYVAEPAARGVLVLHVNSWPSNTRLAKLLGSNATIACNALHPSGLPNWCVTWCASRYQKQLTPAAARLLVDLVGAEMGLLDQELAKLATYVGEEQGIDEGDVDRLVGSSRAENAWKIFDAIAAGQPGAALAILDRVLEEGEEPIGILGALSWQLRRLAQAARLTQPGRPLRVALQQVGIHPYRVSGAEQQLRHLGRRRAYRLFDWLLETDLGLKGASPLPPRTQLERLVARLASKDP